VNKGFYIIMAAQFSRRSPTIAARRRHRAADAGDAPSWLTPYLKFFFVAFLRRAGALPSAPLPTACPRAA